MAKSPLDLSASGRSTSDHENRRPLDQPRDRAPAVRPEGRRRGVPEARHHGDRAVARPHPGDRARRGRAHHPVERHEGDRLLPRRAVSGRRRGGAAGRDRRQQEDDRRGGGDRRRLPDPDRRRPAEGLARHQGGARHVRRRHGGGPAACARRESAARHRGAASDVCGGPRLHLAAVRGARPVRRARRGRRRRDRRLSSVVGPEPRERRSSAPARASWRITSATGWCRRRTCCSTAA